MARFLMVLAASLPFAGPLAAQARPAAATARSSLATATEVAPSALASDRAGNLYVAEMGARRVRKITPEGMISTLAGAANTTGRSGGDGGPAARALLGGPMALAVDTSGSVYILDMEGVQDCISMRIRRVTAAGVISTIAGGPSGFGTTGANCGVTNGLAVDASGAVHVADPDLGVMRVGAGGAVENRFPNLHGPLARLGRGFLVGQGSDMRALGGTRPLVFAGDSSCGRTADRIGMCVRAGRIVAIAVDSLRLYFADNTRVYRWGPELRAVVVAGTGAEGFSGDGGPATAATFRQISGLAVDGRGNLFIGDYGTGRIRRVDAAGVITSIAGNGSTDGAHLNVDEP